MERLADAQDQQSCDSVDSFAEDLAVDSRGCHFDRCVVADSCGEHHLFAALGEPVVEMPGLGGATEFHDALGTNLIGENRSVDCCGRDRSE